MLDQADTEFIYLEEQCHKREHEECDMKLHAIALITLFNFALNLQLTGKDLIELLYDLNEERRLHQVLISPFLMLLDDRELICRKYGHSYLLFLSEKAQGKDDEEIMKVLFTQ